MSNDYPKQLKMTELSKLEMLEAVDDCLECIKSQYNNPNNQYTVTVGGESFTLPKYHSILHRSVYFIKGMTQPRYLRRIHRRNEIWNESFRIAIRTGSNTKEVYDFFLYLMDGFVERN